MQFVTSTLVAFSTVALANAGTFQQVGSTLVGTVDSSFGKGLAMSADGSVLAIGAPGVDSGLDIDAGQVSLYNYNGTDWMPGMIFTGAAQELISDRISLSGNGDFLAFRRARTSSPDVAVVFDTSTGTQLGGELSCAFNGIEVTLASTGTRVAVSCETFSTIGRVETFDYVGNTWVSLGTIDGDDTGSLFGWVTVFDSTGNRLAISSPNQDVNSLVDTGRVQVYDFDGSNWNQLGSDLTGTDAGEQFGFSLDMSSDGSSLVVGSPRSDGGGTVRGKVTTFDLVGGTIWQVMGTAISGEADNDKFGRSISMSMDGSTIAASSYLHNFSRGHVKLYSFNGNDWNEVGEIEGGSDFDTIGLGTKSIALDDSGDILAIGILGLDNTAGESIGGVEVFELVSATSMPSATPTSAPTPIILSTGGVVSPPVALSKFDWDLDRVGNVTVSFTSATDMEELMLNYSMNLRNYTVQILEEDCLTLVPQSVIDSESTVTIVNQTHGDLVVTMDVMQDTVVGSSVWADTAAGLGLLSVCVRVDLINSDAAQTSVHFHEQKLFITIDLTQDFHVENIDLARIAPSEESETTEIDYDINACHCDETYSCTDEVHVQGSDLYICVLSNEANVDIISVPTVHLKHDNTSYMVVENTVEDSLTEVTTNLIGGNLAVIRTQLISELFNDTNPSNLTVWGDVILAFTANRRLGGPLMTPALEDRRSMMKTKETEMAGFNVEIALSSKSDGDSMEDDRSSGGVLTVSSILFFGLAAMIVVVVFGE